MIPASRQWWLAVSVYVIVLFGVQPWLGFAVDAAKARWGERAFAMALTSVAVLAAAAAIVASRRLLAYATRGELLVLAATLVLYGAGVFTLTIPQERLHYVEYGALAAMIYAGFTERLAGHGAWKPALLAVGITAALGWLDEWVQGAFWERRYFDWRDVELNTRAAFLGVLAAVPLHRAWRRGTLPEQE